MNTDRSGKQLHESIDPGPDHGRSPTDQITKALVLHGNDRLGRHHHRISRTHESCCYVFLGHDQSQSETNPLSKYATTHFPGYTTTLDDHPAPFRPPSNNTKIIKCCTDRLNSPTSIKQDLGFCWEDVNMSSQRRKFSTEYKVEAAYRVIDSGPAAWLT